MRKIEENMIAAIRNAPNYGCSVKSVGANTKVETDHLGGIHVYLHGHCIAIKHRNEDWRVSLAGWNTPTTRSRLGAIIKTFSRLGPNGLGVSSRKGVVRLHDSRGETVIDANGWHKVVC